MKTVRTIRQVVERDEELKQQPKYAVGDVMEVYSGSYEGHTFWIKDIRYNHDRQCFEYLYSDFLMGGWYTDGQLTLLERKKAA